MPQLSLAYTRLQARRHAVDLSGPPLGGALYSIARGLPTSRTVLRLGIHEVNSHNAYISGTRLHIKVRITIDCYPEVTV